MEEANFCISLADITHLRHDYNSWVGHKIARKYWDETFMILSTENIHKQAPKWGKNTTKI